MGCSLTDLGRTGAALGCRGGNRDQEDEDFYFNLKTIHVQWDSIP